MEWARQLSGEKLPSVPVEHHGRIAKRGRLHNEIHYVPAALTSRPKEEDETGRERMRARTQLLTAISDGRKAIGEGADQATAKRLNDAVAEASRNPRARRAFRDSYACYR
jgi:hypothetical protein